jgi:hypothetical protein
MGYTHYWRRKKEFDPEDYRLVVGDFRKLLPVLSEVGVPLAGGTGLGKPIITNNLVWFNGPKNCGHNADHSVVIPWPVENAGGVMLNRDVSKGSWFAGTTIDSRCCDGDCSYETFHFPRVLELLEWERPDEQGLYFCFCKTAFRPYDLAVTAFLVIADHYLGDQIVISSDGEQQHWFDAMLLCAEHFGYGLSFRLD